MVVVVGGGGLGTHTRQDSLSLMRIIRIYDAIRLGSATRAAIGRVQGVLTSASFQMKNVFAFMKTLFLTLHLSQALSIRPSQAAVLHHP
jgi:hypothetical protein